MVRIKVPSWHTVERNGKMIMNDKCVRNWKETNVVVYPIIH
jgi:hypothetical protein